MKTFTIDYNSQSQLLEFIKDNNLDVDQDNILIQIFVSNNEENFILALVEDVLHVIPKAHIIGSTTCGEISQNGSIKDSTVITISILEQTKIKTTLIEAKGSSFNLGQDTIYSFDNYNSEDLKLIITFTDGLNTNGEEYLNGITSVNENIIISGGMAGDNSKFENTLVFSENGITSNGAVAAAFYNKDLNIHTDYSFNWETVGKTHIVEKSDKNRVYQISGMTTVDFYKYYLGDDIEKMLPAIGIEFPLVIKKDGITIARAVLTKHDDGSLSFAGNIPQGSVVQFGHGDVQMIINKGLDTVKKIIDNPIESIFIYSCMARRALLDIDINLEILPLRELAPIGGFFTYGEFYHNCTDNQCSNQLLNQTMTILALSESNMPIDEVSPNIFSHNPPKVDETALHRTQALSTLIDKTTKELESLNQELEIRVKEEIQLNLEKDSLLSVLQTQAQLGDMIEMILHQWRQPLSALTSSVTSTQIYKEADILTDELLKTNLEDMLSYTEHLNTTIEDFRDLFHVSDKSSKIQLDSLVEKSLTVISSLIRTNRIELIRGRNCSCEVFLPIGLMMQVILNILKNAVDALVEKDIENRIIKIDIYEKENNYTIEIADNGGGIPLDILPYIFDKKFTTKGDTDGTGIGLDMSKTIIENKLKGSLTAKNTADGWVVFTITLPNSSNTL
jgi:nitrogen-specific signal transduction histidine kinase